MIDKDRTVRKEATEAFFGYLSDNHEQLDRIYDDLVKVRSQTAKKLGYKNYVELAYALCPSTKAQGDISCIHSQCLLALS